MSTTSPPILRLKDVCDVLVDCRNKTAPYEDSGIPLIRTTNFRDNALDLSSLKYVSEATNKVWSARHQTAPGDVVYCREAPFGMAAIVPDNFYPCLGQRIMVARPNRRMVTSRYLWHALNSPDVYEQAKRVAVGATVKHLRVGDVEALEIPLPPLPEQKRIAAILDKADAIRRKRQEAIRLTEELLRSAFLEMFGDPVTNPKGWDVKKLGELIDMETGFAFQSASYTDTGVRLCRGANVAPQHLDWEDVRYWPTTAEVDARYHLRTNDVVLAMDRPWISGGLKIAMITPLDTPSYLVQRVARIRPKEKLTAHYVYFALAHRAFERHCRAQMTETTVPHISPNDIRSYLVPLPRRAVLDAFSHIAERQETLLRRQRQDTSATLCTALTQHAFSGAL